MPVRVGILGFGAIGRSVVDSLLEHKEEFHLVGFSDVEQVDGTPIPQMPVEEMIHASDIVVEVASHAAVRVRCPDHRIWNRFTDCLRGRPRR